MRSRPPGIRSLALNALKRAKGLVDQEVADATGDSPRMVSHYQMTREPSPGTLEAYAVAMGYDPGAAEPVVLGLERACRAGEAPVSPVDPTLDERRAIDRVAFRTGLAVADLTGEALVRIVRGNRARHARRRAGRLWKTLRKCSPNRRRLLIEKAREYQRWYVAERLCHESARAASHRPTLAMELAELALLAAELSSGDRAWKDRLRGYCFAFVANALRVQGELRRAEETFTLAEELWKTGAHADPGLLAAWRLPDLKASLRRGQRKFQEALDLLDEALALGPEAAGRILLNKAATLEQMEEAEQAVEALNKAAPLVEAGGDRHLLFALEFNRAALLCDLENVAAADELLPAVRALATELRHDVHLVRVLWLQGRVLAGFGRIQDAITALEQVTKDFADLLMAYDCALASVKLASLYLRQGRTTEARELAVWMKRVFWTLGIEREAMAALILFCEAVRTDAASADLAERLFRYLQRWRYDPDLRFEP